MTEADILDILGRRYCQPEWAFLRLLRAGTGYTIRGDEMIFSGGRYRNRWERIMDGWAINCYPSERFTCIAFEVKTSREDFLRELREPWKRQPAMDLSNLFYFVMPYDEAVMIEVPDDCGLMEVRQGERIKIIKRAIRREMESLPLQFVASVARRAVREETG